MWRPRVLVVAGAAALVLVLVAVVSVARGDLALPVGDVFRALVGQGDAATRFVVVELRLPRALTGALVGLALGLAGAVTQTAVRNPLATPEMLGITVGASAGAVAVIVLGGSNGVVGSGLASVGMPLAALAGGLVAAAAIYLLAWRGGIDGYRLVLVGIGIDAIGGAIVYWLLNVADVNDAARALVWITGSLNARGWEHAAPLGFALLLLAPVVLWLGRHLDVLSLGEETAVALGVRVGWLRGGLTLLAFALAAVATSAAGPIMFVALASPQIAQRLSGTPRPPLVGSALVAAALTVTADLLARSLIGAAELPVGVVTAVLGAPFLIYLLVRRR
jgi:iron complex transport system permease protein